MAQLVMDAMSLLEGAYALLIKSTHYPGELVACKRGSPLILGVKSAAHAQDGGGSPRKIKEAARAAAGGLASLRAASHAVEYFLASDASAVVEHTKRVLVLEDGDVVALRNGSYEIYNFSDRAEGQTAGVGQAQSRALETLNMEVSSIMKGGYQHFMQKEIFEQPETVLQTMRGRVKFAPQAAADAAAAAADGGSTLPVPIQRLPDASPATPLSSNSSSLAALSLAALSAPPSVPNHADDLFTEPAVKLGGLAEHLEKISTGRRLVLVGCGTSYHACLAARKVLEELSGLPVATEIASDLLDRCPPLFRDDTCFFVSQSGETSDTLRALEYARDKGALCVGITNTVGSAIARGTDCGVHINAGAEIGVASTKAYTSQIVCLVLVALALSEDSRSRAPKRSAIIQGLGRLPGALRRALQLDREVRALAERLRNEQSLLVFGRGCNYATALEAALKVKEVALMHSEGILAGEMKHGPLALVDELLPILVVATADEMRAKMVSVIEQLRTRGARLVVLCCEGDEGVAAAAGAQAMLVHVPRLPDCLQPVVNVVPLQLLAYHLAVLRGHNVDQPRNLAKSVTVHD